MNTCLKSSSEAEIWFALDGIGDLKALDPDGMPSIFYKKHWEVVGSHVVPDNCNDSWVSIIPKVKRSRVRVIFWPYKSLQCDL
jgi:hypothetical protein